MDLGTASASAPRWQYDVLLSFVVMGHHGFIPLLFDELQNVGNLKTFKCDWSSVKATPERFMKNIERSRFAIVVLSREYASSEFCLKLLTRIFLCMEDKNRIVPIYYDVDPADVLNQTGSYAHAFTEHEQNLRGTTSPNLIVQWRDALKMVANLSGWNLKDYE